MLREVDAVANSEAAYRKIRLDFDIEWVQVYVGPAPAILFRSPFRLRGRSVRSLPVCHARQSPRRSELVQLRPQRPQSRARSIEGRSNGPAGSALAGAQTSRQRRAQSQRVTRLQTFLGRPAILVAVAIASSDDLARNAAEKAPVVMSVKLIDERCAGRNRVASAIAQPAPGRRRADRAGRLRLQADRSAGPAGRDLRMDAEAARRGDRQQRHPVHCGRARRLRAAGRARARPHAPHRRDHRVGRIAAAPPCAARSALRPAQPHLLRRAPRDRRSRTCARAARRRPCSTSTSTTSRTSTTRSAIRSATN